MAVFSAFFDQTIEHIKWFADYGRSHPKHTELQLKFIQFFTNTRIRRLLVS